MRVQDFYSRHFVQVVEISCIHYELKVDDVLLRHEEKQIIKVSHIYDLTHKRLNLSIIRASIEIYVEIFIVTIINYLIDKVI